MKKSKSKRVLWVDIYKGVLIFLMVFAHTPTIFVKYIYAFHMAAFFFVSGYTQNYDKDDLLNFGIKKFKSLVIPYYKVNVVFILLIILLGVVGFQSVFYVETIGIERLIEFLRYLSPIDLGGTTWFLLVLFMGTICAKIVNDIMKKIIFTEETQDILKVVLSGIILVIAYFLYYKNKNTLMFFIDLVPASMFFLQLGNYVNKYPIKFKNFIYKIILGIILTGVSLYLIHEKKVFIEWINRLFSNGFNFIILSVWGIALMYILSKGIEKTANTKFNFISKIFEYFGKNTLPIMLYHFLMFRVFFVILYVLGFCEKEQLKSLIPLYDGIGISLLTTIFAIVFSLGLDHIIKFMKNKTINKIKINIIKNDV